MTRSLHSQLQGSGRWAPYIGVAPDADEGWRYARVWPLVGGRVDLRRLEETGSARMRKHDSIRWRLWTQVNQSERPAQVPETTLRVHILICVGAV